MSDTKIEKTFNETPDENTIISKISENPQYGACYKVTFNYTENGLNKIKDYYYRCDYPVSTGFLKILSEKLSLGVARKISGNTISSSITLSIDGNDVPTAAISAGNIVLDGNVIAAAITASDLNINNTTYLHGNGNVEFAQGENKRGSRFDNDGSGSLAGGLISWENTGDLTVKGRITATSG